ncbi:MAG: CinA family protein [Treponema sp.]|nr:CinA family protein [Treponema sp.]
MLELNIDSELSIPQLLTRAEITAKTTVEKLKARSVTLALAESCTAGMISSLLAEVPGASNVLWGSFVCYTKEAKILMLDLKSEELGAYGLVSKETACSMALGAMNKSGADIGVSVTGLAGPLGDGSGAAVGTVWIACANSAKTEHKEHHFTGSRNAVRIRAAIAALEMIDMLI